MPGVGKHRQRRPTAAPVHVHFEIVAGTAALTI
jgi:hypothetical protein